MHFHKSESHTNEGQGFCTTVSGVSLDVETPVPDLDVVSVVPRVEVSAEVTSQALRAVVANNVEENCEETVEEGQAEDQEINPIGIKQFEVDSLTWNASRGFYDISKVASTYGDSNWR